MLTPTTMKHFKLFRNPFLDDVQEDRDVFLSQSHRYAHAAMIDAARNGGFVAVCGECGAGKSVMRRKLIADLNNEGDVRVILPQTIDKGQLTSNHILDAIIMDLDPDAPIRRTREAKARQVQRMLLDSSRAGMRHVLVIEEAHDLSVPTMKQLKRLWEIEDGYRKVLGIVLVGQQELAARLNRQTHPEMREVILRCLIATLDPLSRDDCEGYVKLKFSRVGKDAGEVLADGYVDALMARLTTRQGWSAVYPLYINNLLAKAMNMAAQIGAPQVTPDIIEEA
ncbi:MAG: type II secretory protein ExeA [Alphaproteobacteria bacterium]|nr:MAG: type II secretory protein ExeA [Alphaproteobacteria bacterium]